MLVGGDTSGSLHAQTALATGILSERKIAANRGTGNTRGNDTAAKPAKRCKGGSSAGLNANLVRTNTIIGVQGHELVKESGLMSDRETGSANRLRVKIERKTLLSISCCRGRELRDASVAKFLKHRRRNSITTVDLTLTGDGDTGGEGVALELSIATLVVLARSTLSRNRIRTPTVIHRMSRGGKCVPKMRTANNFLELIPQSSGEVRFSWKR